jgi:hypothetical protein
MQRLSLRRCSFSAISRGGWCLPLTTNWAICSSLFRAAGVAAGKQGARAFLALSERITLLAADAEVWLAGQAGEEAAGIGGLCPAIDESRYRAAVERIKQFIYDGDCYQVNYTFPIDFSWFGSPLALYARLRQRQPVRYGGFVGNRSGGVVSLSPELFLERHGERLLTRPMKGTAARSEPSETLRNSVKDRAENLMIVDLLRNDLGRLAEPGSVKVDRLFEIEDYRRSGRWFRRCRRGSAARFRVCPARTLPLWIDYRRTENSRHADHRSVGRGAASSIHRGARVAGP